jgi:hypothetical protein
MEVVERRHYSNSAIAPSLRRSRSVRSSLRLVGARWRKAVANAAINNVACPPSSQEPSQLSIVKFLNVSDVPSPQPLSLAPPSQQQKQRSSRTSWLHSLFNHQNKLVKSSAAGEGKEKEHKLRLKATWISELTTQQNKQHENKPTFNQSSENKETVENHLPKTAWVLGVTKELAEQTESTSLHILAEWHRKPHISSPLLNAETLRSPRRTYMRQKSNSLSRCSPSPVEQFLQEQHQFLPLVSSVGSKRRNSMWALSSSKSGRLSFI